MYQRFAKPRTSSLTRVFSEPQFPKTLRQCGVLGVSRDFGDGVDILRRPEAGTGGIREEETRGAATEKHQVVEQRAKDSCRGLQKLPVRIAHAPDGVAGK